MKRLLMLGLLVGLASSTYGQSRTAQLAIDWDVDVAGSANAVYPLMLGQNGSPFGAPIQGKSTVSTSGASATITGVVPADDPFELIGVGDVLYFNVSGTTSYRVVITKTSVDEVVVNSTITLTAENWSWRKLSAATSGGWVDVGGYERVTFTFHLNQYVGDGNGLDYAYQCKAVQDDTSFTIIDPASGTVNNTTAAVQESLVLNGDFSYCRVEVFHNTADDGDDLTTNAEQLNINITLGSKVI